ncbi:16S rRNA (adenine(1518)-N(6)/adenine(1519)-N(6))-dimethyltransferase RsmA [Thermosediminibacter litoriperuensis]|uniref:Ribosomal RNA small subunit methyltransferase A n=1 Tax=Thermosediminibacter litoriperuensis TaxID=291989 RepID=A0A5S5AWN4_9FIRM|nr:16S rRNA (adenine(1518)-N(6)/adenine(1519)-N(6))-dimethyltransferase RsmA [Thermosediminibacter litoriperuensis]TYP57372.1 16S rRNA (adenine1518-N6/adenine1519-N6)-dimethyltransferase [Thermosediminibacter litoriperuensis]
MNTRAIMREFGIRPSKRLGQHFLVDEAPLNKMLEAARLQESDEVLEIGPGLGVLTLELCRRAKKVVAVEKDPNLIPVLEKLTKSYKNICLLREDVLKLDMDQLRREYFEGEFKVVANLPYYITSPVIMKIINNRHLIKMAVIMVQKEVAQRLAAAPGSKDYGILSIAAQLYAGVDLICHVGRSAFLPPPKVDSAVVRLVLKDGPVVPLKDERLFFRVVEAAFGERRKTVRNSLISRLGLSPGDVEEALGRAGIDGTRRAETLTIQEFAALAREISKNLED